MKRKSLKRCIHYFLLCLFLISCAEEEFGQTTRTTTEAIQAREEYTIASNCDNNFTLVKPPVDFLFLFDNSTSTQFITPDTKAAIRNTLKYVSEEFNYHVMVAPLLPGVGGVNDGASLAVTNTDGLDASAQSLVVANDSADLLDRVANITKQTGSREYGFARAVDIISNNRSNGIFRDNAYTIIVTISNEDSDWPGSNTNQPDPQDQVDDFNNNKNALVNLSNSMSAEQFRYITIGPERNNCAPSYISGYREAHRYKRMSLEIYKHNRDQKQNFVDPSPLPATDVDSDGVYEEGEIPDYFNLCSGNYQSIFNKVNDTIKAVVLNHTYNHWPITLSFDQTFDPITLRVFKFLDDNNQIEIPESVFNGYEYLGFQQTPINTRILPTPGEPASGFLIKLNGTAQVTYPECIVIKTLATADYFGYIVVNEEPNLSSVNFTKNGQSYSESSTNGWQYLGFQENFNIRINSPTNYSPALPPANRTGYVFKLNGNAVYTNGDSIKLDFFPLPK